MKNKLNNKGMVISGVLYSILILFVALVFGVLALLSSSNYTFAKIKTDVLNELNGSSSDFCYEFDYSTGTILNYYGEVNGCGTKVVIPETIDGIPVQTISAGAFYNKGIERVDLSNAIMLKTIEGGATPSEGAFANNKIKYLTFGDNSFLEEIGAYAFYNNQIEGELFLSGVPTLRKISQDAFAKNKLTSIDFSGLRILEVIDDMAFYGNVLKDWIYFTDTTKLQRIGIGAFANNNIDHIDTAGLTNLEIIDNYAFHNNNLETFDFTNLKNLTEIGISAFSYNLLTVGDFSETKLTNIKERAFECGNLKSVKFPETILTLGTSSFYNNQIEGHVDLSMIQTQVTGTYVFYKNNISSFTYGGKIIDNGLFAFNNITSVSEENIPRVIQIGSNAFFENTTLKSVDLSFSNKITHIFNTAFANCNINELKLNVSSSASSLFFGVGAFANNKIPGVLDFSNMTKAVSIDSYAFKNNKLTGFVKPSILDNIGNGAFVQNEFPEEDAFITIDVDMLDEYRNETVHTKKLMAYAGKGGEVTIPNDIGWIGVASLEGANITKVNFPSSVLKIDSNALAGNPLEGELDLTPMKDLFRIENNAFSYTVEQEAYENGKFIECNLKDSYDGSNHSKYLSDLSCKTTARNTFNSQREKASATNIITSINFTDLDHLLYIGSSSFAWFGYLKEIIGMNTLSSLQTINNYAFRYCYSLEKGIDLSGSHNLKTVGSYIFNGLSVYKDKIDLSGTDMNSVPDSFARAKDNKITTNAVTEIFLPNNATTISQYAFENLRTKKVNFTDKITSIGSNAFYYSNFGEDFELPSNIKTISGYAFYGSNISKELTLPNTLTTLGNDSFSSNKIRGTLKIPSSLTSMSSTVFAHNAIETVDYSESSLTKIITLAFYNNSNLKNIIFNDKITAIGRYAFKNAEGLTQLTIPAAVETIGGHAFEGCINLTNVTVLYNDQNPIYRFNEAWRTIGFTKAEKPANNYSTYTLDLDNVNSFDASTPIRQIKINKSGYYRLEAWGAQGGSYSTINRGGYGGYAAGTVYLEKDSYLYIFTGTQPTEYQTGSSAYIDNPGGLNGGGIGLTGKSGDNQTFALGGGGATDFRIGTSQSLYSRIIVAGGGSGSSNIRRGCSAGEVNDEIDKSKKCDKTYVGKQTSAGGTGNGAGGFGYGANTFGYSYQLAIAPAGGGGWYGGGSNYNSANTISSKNPWEYMTGGGSSYVYSEQSKKDYPYYKCIDPKKTSTCEYLKDELGENVIKDSHLAFNPVIYNGNDVDSNGDLLGNIGDGHSRVTFLGETLEIPTIEE